MAESLSRSRLEAFSDGVIAVIITIMVLELKVPGGHEITNSNVLRENAKIFVVYLLSFVQVGIYWVNHHYLVDDLETVTHGILWANLGVLFTLSLLPFGVEWIGSRGIAPVPVAVYATCFCFPAAAWPVLSHTIRRRTGVPPAAGYLKQACSVLLSVGAIFVALRSPWTALSMLASVALLWLIPPRRILEKTRASKPTHTVSSHSS